MTLEHDALERHRWCARILVGDVIVGIGGAQIGGVDDLHKVLTEDTIGRSLPMRLLRGAEERYLVVEPAELAP